MTDFINKVISLILVFAMLVLGPLVNSYTKSEMLAQRSILNEVQVFIDKVKDTASISESDINDLYIACNAYGIAVDVKVKRIIRTVVTRNDPANINNDALTVYIAVDEMGDLININVGDSVQVSIEEIGVSPARKLVYSVLKIDEGPFEFQLAGVVG